MTKTPWSAAKSGEGQGILAGYTDREGGRGKLVSFVLYTLFYLNPKAISTSFLEILGKIFKKC
jgi:hypothetical protein